MKAHLEGILPAIEQVHEEKHKVSTHFKVPCYFAAQNEKKAHTHCAQKQQIK